jgi:predicted AAA+ superfamily ATPase
MEKERIIDALLPWNFWEKRIDTGIPREDYLKKLKEYSKMDEIVALTGVRRSGKSTILLQLLAERISQNIPAINTLYVNFEDPKFYNFLGIDLLDQIWTAYHEFLKPEGKVYLVLDEVQRVKGWEHWVRSQYDRKEPVKIWVTGSNAELLSSEFSNVLTGRHFQVSVTPLTFKEFLQFNRVEIQEDKFWQLKNKKRLQNFSWPYLKMGGFPKVVLTQGERLQRELLSQYFTDILTKDVAERYKVKEVGKLQNLALFYSTNFTRPYSFNKVKNVAEVPLSLDSIHRFSRYLEDSFLIQFLLRFSYSLKNQMQAQRKVYLVDNGLHTAVAFKFSEDKGKLLENAVSQQLRNWGKEIYYFSEKKEVDFLCKEGLKITEIINVCYHLEDKETLLRETSALFEGMKYFNLKKAVIVIGEGEKSSFTEKGCHISIVPFYQWALGL